MQLGTSPYLDFAICAGPGVANSACLIAGTVAVRAIRVAFPSLIVQRFLCLSAFVIFGSAMFAIAFVIGDTRGVRDANSVLGFVAGMALLFPLILRTIRGEVSA